jgi:protein SCO1/2
MSGRPMKARTVQLLLILGTFIAGLMLFSAVVLIVGGRNPVPNILSSASIGGPFRLIDQDGRAVSNQDFNGRPFLVFFGFIYCPDICPTALFEMSEILRALGPDTERVGALFITVDPERDTPEKIKDYLSSFHPHLRGLTGDPAAIAAVEKSYRVYSKKVPLDGGGYTMDHTALVYLMDKEGRFVAPFNLKRRPEDAAAELRRYF